MPPAAPISPTISARIIHASLVLGVVLFWVLAWYVARGSEPVSTLPDRRVLYIALVLVSAALFGGAMFTANRLTAPARGASQDEWWKANLGRVVLIWALVEAPAILGTVIYLLTRDFRVLLATFTGLLFFAAYRPSRLTER